MMGLLHRLFGGNRRGGQNRPPRAASRTQRPQDTPVSGSGGPATGDDAAIHRYRYLLRTAPPERIEQAHAEAFAALTPEQRRTVLTELGRQVPASERAASDDPQALARMATRAEMRQPGTMERTFAARGTGMGGVGLGGVLAGGLLASLAGAFVGTAIANEIFDGDQGNDGDDGASDQAGDQSGDQVDTLAAGSDSADDGFGDAGSGGAFGGGDLGVGDVGSGDFGGGGDFGGFDA